ncbi:MAG: hypothetical protein U1E65_27295 [Myxococcota bacterium]
MRCKSLTTLAIPSLAALLALSACDGGRGVPVDNHPSNNSGKDGGTQNNNNDGGTTQGDAGTTGTNGTPCADGRVLCNGRCVNTTDDARHCGMCNHGCMTGQVCTSTLGNAPQCHTVAACTGSECTGFSYCDIGSRSCTPGCVRDEQCGNNETCNLNIHDCDCKSGFHRCNGLCVSDNDVATCGGSCSPCATDPNGTASCSNGQCQLSCSNGTQTCGQRCTPPNDPAACGPSCTVCPGDAHGQATCDGTSCGLQCQSGFHVCGNTCVPNTAVASCGNSCDACPTDQNGTASCDGNSCQVACNQGYRLCNGACAQCPNVASTTCDGNDCIASPCQQNQELCGPSCVNCPSNTGVNAFMCNGNNQCVISSCQSGYLLCNNLCSQCPSGGSVSATGCGSGGQCEATACADNSRFCPSGCCGLTDGQITFGLAEFGIKMAVAANGDVHALFENRSGSDYGLHHAVRSQGASSFTEDTVVLHDQNGNSPEIYDFAVDGTTVHAAYVREDGNFNRTLIYTVKEAGGSWTETPFNDPVQPVTIRVRARNGKVYLAFREVNMQAQQQIVVGINSGGQWSAMFFVSPIYDIYGYDLAIDPTNDLPVLAVSTSERVQVVHFDSDGTPSSATIETILPERSDPSLAVDATGTVHVVYSAGSIKYTRGTTSFTPQNLASGQTISRLRVDGMGHAHILYGSNPMSGLSFSEFDGQGFRTVNLPLLHRPNFHDDSDFDLDSSGAPIFGYTLYDAPDIRWLH